MGVVRTKKAKTQKEKTNQGRAYQLGESKIEGFGSGLDHKWVRVGQKGYDLETKEIP